MAVKHEGNQNTQLGKLEMASGRRVLNGYWKALFVSFHKLIIKVTEKSFHTYSQHSL